VPASFTIGADGKVASLAAPTPVSPVGVAKSGKVTFTWTPVPGAAGYELWVAAGDLKCTCPAVQAKTKATSQAAKLAPGTYTWVVRALTTSAAGPWSAPAKAELK